jgi:hypothetical protein
MPITLVDDPEAFDAALALVEEFGGAADLSEGSLAHALGPSDDDGELLVASLVAVELPGLEVEADGSLYDKQDLYGSFEAADELFAPSTDGTSTESHASSSSPTQTLAQSTQQPTKTAKATKLRTYNPNRARDEEKKELTYLRTKVVEMEQKLKAMQDAQRAKQAVVAGSSRGFPQAIVEAGNQEEDHSLSTSSDCARNVWKEMASHQLEQRLQSERENRHLKATLEAQIKIARSLEKLLQSRATASVRAVSVVQPCPTTTNRIVLCFYRRWSRSATRRGRGAFTRLDLIAQPPPGSKSCLTAWTNRTAK